MLLRSVARVVAQGGARAPAPSRCVSAWLQGKPPRVDASAGTVASFYYKNIRGAELPSRDHMVAPSQDLRFTVGEFDKQAYGFAVGMLEGLGLKKGHKIGTWMTGEVEQLVVAYAAGLLGIQVVAIDPRVSFAGVKAVLASESLRTLIMSPRWGSEDRLGALHDEFAEEILPAAEGNPAIYNIFRSKRFRALKHIVCTSQEFVEGVVRFRDLPVYGNNGVYADDEIAAVQSYVTRSDAMVQYYSAGADGAAVKGPAASQADVLAATAAAAKALALTSADTVVSTAPLHTLSGLAAGALAPAAVGAKLVLPSAKAFSAAETLAAVTAQAATHVILAAEHVEPIAEALAVDAAKGAKRAYDLSALRGGAVVGAKSGATLGKVALKALA